MFKEVVKKKMKMTPKEFENISSHGSESFFDETRDIEIEKNVLIFSNF